VQCAALGLERDQRDQVQPILVNNRAARIAGGDEHRSFLGEEARRVLADRAKALDHDSRTGELQLDMVPRYVDCSDKTKTGGADLVERDAADLARQPDGAADLILDPAHGQLVGSHVRTRDVLGEIADRRGEGPDQPLLVAQRHFGVGKDHRFAAAVRQTGRGILEGHRSRQPEGFLGADIWRHPDPADRRPAADIVNRNHRLEIGRRPVDVNQLEWSELIGKAKRFFHRILFRAVLACLVGNLGLRSGKTGAA
jgi:hypothetical protein